MDVSTRGFTTVVCVIYFCSFYCFWVGEAGHEGATIIDTDLNKWAAQLVVLVDAAQQERRRSPTKRPLNFMDVAAAHAESYLKSLDAIQKMGDTEVDMDRMAGDLRRLFQIMPNDRISILAGHIALSKISFANLLPGPDGSYQTEGTSSPTQGRWLGQQASSALVKRICEVGFNAGNSALAMLMGSGSNTTMISFDLADKSYSRASEQFIAKVFPGRHRLIKGPSQGTIMEFIRSRPKAPRCDLIYIDGGHLEEQAADDLYFMSLLAYAGRSLVVMDDVDCDEQFCVGPGKAWRSFIAAGRLRQLGCDAADSKRWCWGVYA